MDEIKLPPIWSAVPDDPDERDYKFEDVMGAPPPVMPTFEQGYDTEESVGALPDRHQGYSLGCVTFGGTADVMTSIKKTINKDILLSPRDAYSQIHLPGGASSPRDLYKLANQKGICEDSCLPTYPSSILAENWLRKRDDATPETIQNAFKWRIGPYYSITSLDINVIAQAVFQNDGCGGAFRPVGSQMGHFIFFKGYGMKNGYRVLKYKDSYNPYSKVFYIKDNKYYYDIPPNSPIELFSVWTFQAGNWGDQTMTKLQRKKGTEQVFLSLDGERVWIKEAEDFEKLIKAQPIAGLSWEGVQEVDIFTEPFNGRIIGKPNFSDLLKLLFGGIK